MVLLIFLRTSSSSPHLSEGEVYKATGEVEEVLRTCNVMSYKICYCAPSQ